MLDDATLKEDLNLIQEKYLEKGYWNSMVDSRVIKGKNKDEVSILYKITEGDKRSISNFEQGNHLFLWKIINEMETAMAFLEILVETISLSSEILEKPGKVA